MRKFLLLALFFVLTACYTLPETQTATPTTTATDTIEPTITSTESPSATATHTPLPTDTATATQDPTPTALVPEETIDPTVPNLLPNPGMEMFYDTWVCDEDSTYCVMHKVPVGYEPYYCDEPYMPEKCDALRQGNGNPEDLKMRRPEWKIAALIEYPNRVHSGSSAAQWFTWSGVSQGGLYVVVDTLPGMLCEAGAWWQIWNNYAGDITSEDTTDDDRANITVRIQVNLSGKTFFKAEDNLSSRWYGYDDFPYDTWGEVTYQFVTNSSQTTVFFENLILFPVTNNDVYLDDVYLRCESRS